MEGFLSGLWDGWGLGMGEVCFSLTLSGCALRSAGAAHERRAALRRLAALSLWLPPVVAAGVWRWPVIAWRKRHGNS